MWVVSPVRTMRFSPRKMASSSPLRRMKVSSKSWRWGGGPPPGGTCRSIKQCRPAVSFSESSTVYVSPTKPRWGTFGSSGSTMTSCRLRSTVVFKTPVGFVFAPRATRQCELKQDWTFFRELEPNASEIGVSSTRSGRPNRAPRTLVEGKQPCDEIRARLNL
jgi:hypothetical protein